MDRSIPLTLVSFSYETDAIGQKIKIETERDVFADIRSVTRSEWSAAAEQGLKAELVAVMFAPDYHGEQIAIVSGVRYGVYRTFSNANNETIELYLEKKVGV